MTSKEIIIEYLKEKYDAQNTRDFIEKIKKGLKIPKARVLRVKNVDGATEWLGVVFFDENVDIEKYIEEFNALPQPFKNGIKHVIEFKYSENPRIEVLRCGRTITYYPTDDYREFVDYYVRQKMKELIENHDISIECYSTLCEILKDKISWKELAEELIEECFNYEINGDKIRIDDGEVTLKVPGAVDELEKLNNVLEAPYVEVFVDE